MKKKPSPLLPAIRKPGCADLLGGLTELLTDASHERKMQTASAKSPTLSAKGDEAVARYALGGLSNKVIASRYKLQLPDPTILKREMEAERRRLEGRQLMQAKRTD